MNSVNLLHQINSHKTQYLHMCKLLNSLLYVTLMVPSCPGVELTWLTSLMMEKERGGRGGDDAGGSVREEEAGKP